MDRILDSVNMPSDIKNLSIDELYKLASEIRYFIIDNTSKTGGHVAPSLGTVEMTLALHYVFDTPKDKIVWDVGHQAYAHKIITGRKDRFGKLRTYKGISGFNNIFESEHDALTVGHAATSISAALGLARGRDLKNEDSRIISVIGDGSMTNGLVYEALNNIASYKKNFIIILNDNKMSISENVGGISQYLNKLQATPAYTSMKNDIWDLLGKLPDRMSNRTRDMARRLKESLKNFFIPTIIFEEFGIRYIGPLDGHRIEDLIPMLRYAKNYKGPILLHMITQKGRGYIHAENDPTRFHGLGCFNPETGKTEKGSTCNVKYTDVFSRTLAELSAERKDVVAITAAMPDGTGLSLFKEKFPERFFDVGIAEGHAALFAVGLALQGLKPVCAIYSTFLQRSYDQLIHDAALMNAPVFFVLDRAGIVGDDGPTHHGLFDISYLRSVPSMVIMAPKDEDELRSMIKLGLEYREGPIAVRYPRGEGLGRDLTGPVKDIQLGKSEVLIKGSKVLLIGIGNTVDSSVKAAESVKKEFGFIPTVVNARFVRPLDKETIIPLIESHEIIVTAEENILAGGFGELISHEIHRRGFMKKVVNIGIEDVFVEFGSQEILRKEYGLDNNAIFERIRKEII